MGKQAIETMNPEEYQLWKTIVDTPVTLLNNLVDKASGYMKGTRILETGERTEVTEEIPIKKVGLEIFGPEEITPGPYAQEDKGRALLSNSVMIAGVLVAGLIFFTTIGEK